MSIFLNDPRQGKDPLLNRSANTRLLIDLLGEGIALSLASATASNYLSDQYGSLHRIIYEKCAQLISELMIDISDLSDDNALNNVRVEFLNLKILSVLFRADEQLSYSDTETLLKRVNAVLEALNKGSSLESITEMVQGFAGAEIKSSIEQTSEHSFNIALSSYTQTTTPLVDDVLIDGHRHLLRIKGEGLENTGGPIGSTWGQDLHYHEIYDGQIQPAYDQDGVLHTHEIISGVAPSLVSLQQDIERGLKATKPAHVALSNVTNVTRENMDEPVLSLTLSLGSSYQEDMRTAREGTYENEILGYVAQRELRTWSTIFNTPDTLYLQDNETSTTRSKHRILSRSEITLADGTYEITLPRIKNRLSGETLTFSASYTVSGGLLELPDVLLADGWVEELAWLEVQDGEPVLVDGVCYFARRMRAPDYLNTDGITCNLGAILLEAVVFSLDTKSVTDGLKIVTDSDLSYRTRARRYRDYSWVMDTINNVEDPITPADFPTILKRSFNASVLGDLLRLYINDTEATDLVPEGSSLILRWYDLPTPHVRSGLSAYLIDGAGARSSIVSPGDVLRVSYPFGFDQNTTFSALNHTGFKLNAHRYDRLKDSYAGRGRVEARSSNTILGHPQVLNRASKVEVGVYERREISTSLLKTDTLNTKSVLGSGFLLNKSSLSVSINPSKVYKPAVVSATVKDGRINIADLGFYPERIISIISNSTYYSYAISGGYIIISDPPSDDVELEITALSTKPFTSSEEWFRNEEYAEGQIPFVNKAFAPYEDVPSIDDYMSNPEGRPLTDASPDEARRYTGSVFTESRGSDGELVFAEDTWTEIAFSGDSYTESASPIRDVPYNPLNEISAIAHNTNPMIEQVFHSYFICGGDNGGTVYDASILNGPSILNPSSETEQVSIYLIP